MAQSEGVTWRGEEYSARFAKAAAEGLTAGAEYLLGEAIQLAPIDRGPLRGSGHVEPATPSDLEAVVSFDTPYAVAQHEGLHFRHDEGQAKYLEEPAVTKAPTIQGIIGARIGGISG